MTVLVLFSLPVQAAPGTVCLELSDIDHTEIVDDSTILFDMKDHAVWENLLPEACDGLKAANGFEYTGTQPKICGNSDLIRVVDSDTACALGPFVLNRAR